MADRRPLKGPEVFLAFARYADEANVTLTLKVISSVTGLSVSAAWVRYKEAKQEVLVEKGLAPADNQETSVDTDGKTLAASKRGRKRKVDDATTEESNDQNVEDVKKSSKGSETGKKRGKNDNGQDKVKAGP